RETHAGAVSEPLAGGDRAIWTRADGGRMATNTHIPVRSARRCILRPAVTKFFFATAVAIATCFALALSGAITAGPGIAQATGPSSTQNVSGQSYGYPVKPFDQEHFVRSNLGDPRVQFF